MVDADATNHTYKQKEKKGSCLHNLFKKRKRYAQSVTKISVLDCHQSRACRLTRSKTNNAVEAEEEKNVAPDQLYRSMGDRGKSNISGDERAHQSLPPPHPSIEPSSRHTVNG